MESGHIVETQALSDTFVLMLLISEIVLYLAFLVCQFFMIGQATFGWCSRQGCSERLRAWADYRVASQHSTWLVLCAGLPGIVSFHAL